MTRYELLVNALDRLLTEAPKTATSYHPAPDDLDAVGAARAKAYIHLLLKVYFGLLTFAEREPYVTEGSYDGG